MQMTTISTDESMMELACHGTADFPFAYYHEDIRLFDGGRMGWHWHREIELVSVARGTVLCLIGSMKIPIVQGEGIFINGGVIHGFEAPEEGVIPNILLAPEFLAPEGSRIHEQYIKPLSASAISHLVLRPPTPWQAEALADLEEVYRLCRTRADTWELGVHGRLERVWAALYTHREECALMDGVGVTRLSQARLKRMMRFIEQNHPRRLLLNDIAKAADISPSEALRCFRAGMQASPIAYLNQYRLARARHLLLGTSRSVTEIAQSVGFESTSYFDRLFKRAFGVSPRDLRGRATREKWE